MLLCFPSGACRAFDIRTEDFQSGPPFSLSESPQSLFLFCYYIHQCVSLPISSASYPPFLFFLPSRPPPDALFDSIINVGTFLIFASTWMLMLPLMPASTPRSPL